MVHEKVPTMDPTVVVVVIIVVVLIVIIAVVVIIIIIMVVRNRKMKKLYSPHHYETSTTAGALELKTSANFGERPISPLSAAMAEKEAEANLEVQEPSTTPTEGEGCGVL